MLFLSGQSLAQRLVSVTQFGAVSDAKNIGGVWVGTDNSQAINRCAAYCRANGLTMFFPKGNWGVASTIWLVNPDKDKLVQASITVVGSNRGAYRGQSTSANICVLKNFKPGKIVEVNKKNGVVKEPNIVPVLGISNGRQVHISGVGIQGTNKKDLICAVAIGNVSVMTSIENCSLNNLYAGTVFPGLRPSPNESVVDHDNGQLVVEQCTFDNAYNIVCAGTQPYVCEYRNNWFIFTKSAFTGNLITNCYEQSGGSHKFSSNNFGTLYKSGAESHDTVYFDLRGNEILVDSCRFETAYEREVPEVLIRQFPDGGQKRMERITFSNNTINFRNVSKNPSKYRPIIDTRSGNRMIIQGNYFQVTTATRIKANGAIFIGNTFLLMGGHNLSVVGDTHQLGGSAGNIAAGRYDFNHFIRQDSAVSISLPNDVQLQEDADYKLHKGQNAFEITEAGKKRIDAAKVKRLSITYKANDGAGIGFRAWGENRFNPPHGWLSENLTMISNKVRGKSDAGVDFVKTLKADYEAFKK